MPCHWRLPLTIACGAILLPAVAGAQDLRRGPWSAAAEAVAESLKTDGTVPSNAEIVINRASVRTGEGSSPPVFSAERLSHDIANEISLSQGAMRLVERNDVVRCPETPMRCVLQGAQVVLSFAESTIGSAAATILVLAEHHVASMPQHVAALFQVDLELAHGRWEVVDIKVRGVS